MYRPITILSGNRKTEFPSINLTRENCRPSSTCARLCYARYGHIAMAHAVKKQKWVSEYLQGDDLSNLVVECLPHRIVRWCGSGDILPQHVDGVLKLAEDCPQTIFIGFTRKHELLPELNNVLPNLDFLCSMDGTTPQKVWDSVDARIAFGPRLRDDDVPDDPRISVVFPARIPGARVMKEVPRHPLDCPAGYDHSIHCITCEMCFAHMLPRTKTSGGGNEPHS